MPLVQRAYELWRELEREAGEQLLHVTGAVEGGPRIFEGALRSCHEHDLPHEALDGAEIGRRFPAYRLPPGLQLVYQPDGGFVLPERCIVAHVNGALAHGAVVRTGERVLEWEAGENGVRVRTDRGEVEAERLVLTAGAWSQDVARLPVGSVTPQRQVLAWLDPLEPELFAPERFPVFNVALEEGHLYGFPVYGVPGFKVGFYDHEASGRTRTRSHASPRPDDEVPVRRFVERYFPRRSRPDAGREDVPVRALSRRALPDRPAPGHRTGRLRRRLLGPRVQVLLRRRRDPRRPRAEGATRHDIGFLRLARFDRTGIWPSQTLDGCGREDSNLQGPHGPTGPKPAAYASSATPAEVSV